MIAEEVKFSPESLGLPFPIRVERLRLSCGGCPMAWSGFSGEEEVYVRYRWGYLRIDLGENTVFGCQVDIETEEEATAHFADLRRQAANGGWPTLETIEGMESSDKVMREFMKKKDGCGDHSYSGTISYEDIKRLTSKWFVWPEEYQ